MTELRFPYEIDSPPIDTVRAVSTPGSCIVPAESIHEDEAPGTIVIVHDEMAISDEPAVQMFVRFAEDEVPNPRRPWRLSDSDEEYAFADVSNWLAIAVLRPRT